VTLMKYLILLASLFLTGCVIKHQPPRAYDKWGVPACHDQWPCELTWRGCGTVQEKAR
jgi:hypothetical protein